MSRLQLIVIAVAGASLAAPAARAQSPGRFDPKPAWPLCGRIADNPPPGWVAFAGCPSDRWGNAEATDLPLSSTFGPRQKASEGFRYDYHRGIDIPAPVFTPVFAIADGQVTLAGLYPAYEDMVIQVRHLRPGTTTCYKVGCYYSNYLHLVWAVVVPGQTVHKGDLIGFTGVGASGFPHLHFEIRDAPWFDPFSNWQRDAIHPLYVLPYEDDSTPTILFDRVDVDDPERPEVRLTVISKGVDIVRVELALYDRDMNELAQPGDAPNAHGYNVRPPWLDMDEWNFQYSHKDTPWSPWSLFGRGGVFECPYADRHGDAYSPHVHLDGRAPGRISVGRFNGLTIAPGRYSTDSEAYVLGLGFHELVGPARCIEARVHDTAGNEHVASWGMCRSLPPLSPWPRALAPMAAIASGPGLTEQRVLSRDRW